MRIKRASLADCGEATDLVVVIDVIRAFTTAAYAFSAGASRIYLTGEVSEALELRNEIPNSMIMGEVDGIMPEGFDFGNSPAAISRVDLQGKSLIQRTSSGTQGVVRSRNAKVILTSSFCCAQATVNEILNLSPEEVTFVETRRSPEGYGDEDVACADYLEALLKGKKPYPKSYLDRVLNSFDAKKFVDKTNPDFNKEDLDYCIQLDRFDFAMKVERKDQLLILAPIK